MKVIIAGSRMISDYAEVERAIKDSGFDIDTVISGGAKGVDQCGEMFAARNGLPIIEKRPYWKVYGKRAGKIRNSMMLAEADAVVVVWDGVSRGTKDTIDKAQYMRIPTHVHIVKENS